MGMYRRLLESNVDADIHDTIDDLEDRIEDIEDESTESLSPDSQYELGQTIQALRGDIERLEREIANVASAPFAAMEPYENRLRAVEDRLESMASSSTDTAKETSEGVVDDVVAIPESVVAPKRRHFYHDMPRWF